MKQAFGSLFRAMKNERVTFRRRILPNPRLSSLLRFSPCSPPRGVPALVVPPDAPGFVLFFSRQHKKTNNTQPSRLPEAAAQQPVAAGESADRKRPGSPDRPAAVGPAARKPVAPSGPGDRAAVGGDAGEGRARGVPIDVRDVSDLRRYYAMLVEDVLADDDGDRRAGAADASRKLHGLRLVDLDTVVRVLCPDLLSEKLASKIFAAYKRADGDDKVQIREFFTGLSSCCRGTTDQKLVYIFSLFDVKETGKLSRDELRHALDALSAVGDIHVTLMRSTSTLRTFSTSHEDGEKAGTTPGPPPAESGRGPTITVGRSPAAAARSPASDEPVPPPPPSPSTSRAFPPAPPGESDVPPPRPANAAGRPANPPGSSRAAAREPGRPRSSGTYSVVYEAANDMIRALNGDDFHACGKAEASNGAPNPRLSGKKARGADISTDDLINDPPDSPRLAQPQASSDPLAAIMLERTGPCKEEISLIDFLRWIHRNPSAFSYLDKLQRITSTTAGHTQRKHLAKEERAIIQRCMEEQHVVAGDTCYIISAKWWRLWADYTGFRGGNDHHGCAADGELIPAPDSVDNQDLLRDPEPLLDMIEFPMLKNNLTEADYVVVPESAWNYFYSWYGGGPIIRRPAIADAKKANRLSHIGNGTLRRSAASLNLAAAVHGRPAAPAADHAVLDLYPLLLGLGLLADEKPEVKPKCIASRNITLAEFRELACRQLQVDSSLSWYFLAYFDDTPLVAGVLLSPQDTLTLEQAGVVDRQTILLCQIDQLDKRYHLAPTVDAVETTGTGLVGLKNLGNTCYMSSALQCLSQTKLLREYFLTDSYRKQPESINRPLAHAGERPPPPAAAAAAAAGKSLGPGDKASAQAGAALVEAFAELMKQIWSAPEAVGSIAPTKLRAEGVKRSPEFGGNMQHDAQELLGLVLDGMHDALNSVAKKVPIANPDYAGQLDEELANTCWANHLRRESSIIVSLFQGQFKSHTRCDACRHEIVSFPPFLFLSAPLPGDMHRNLRVTVVLSGGARLPFQRTLRVRKDGTVNDVVLALREMDPLLTKCDFVAADVQNHYVFAVLRKTKPVSEIRECDAIFIYEGSASGGGASQPRAIRKLDSVTHLAGFHEEHDEPDAAAGPAAGVLKINVVFRKLRDEWRIYGKKVQKPVLYGIPLMFFVVSGRRSKQMTAVDLYRAVVDRMRKVYGLHCTPFPQAPAPGSPADGAAAAAAADAAASPGSPKRKLAAGSAQHPIVLKYVNRMGTRCTACDAPECRGCRIPYEEIPLRCSDYDTVALEWPKEAKAGGGGGPTLEVERLLCKVEEGCPSSSADGGGGGGDRRNRKAAGDADPRMPVQGAPAGRPEGDDLPAAADPDRPPEAVLVRGDGMRQERRRGGPPRGRLRPVALPHAERRKGRASRPSGPAEVAAAPAAGLFSLFFARREQQEPAGLGERERERERKRRRRIPVQPVRDDQPLRDVLQRALRRRRPGRLVAEERVAPVQRRGLPPGRGPAQRHRVLERVRVVLREARVQVRPDPRARGRNVDALITSFIVHTF
ncbi:MAG: hypothetical protein BJ554DRAFT_6140 [Olpidium bornovanus]|uniref:Ubiquitinyl hydrolase 1 n=1 Tax=Olpidium bornovanus TaxID=278681 RepID=A0A8H8DK86_9FUNG|nr:MAG: hypothetical protein BJ554DRAFT_6140 [Olpidium bornovanus]